MAGGTECVSVGSMKAASGTRCGLMTPFFSCANWSSRMALGETSLPVPEVDEMAVARGEQTDTEGVLHALIVAHEGGEELGEIQCAASADADDAGGIGGASAFQGGVEGGDRGFACWCAVGADGAACSEQFLLHAIDDGCERGGVNDVDASRGKRRQTGEGFGEAARAEGEAVGLQKGDGPHGHRLLGERGARSGLVLHLGDGCFCRVERELGASLEANDVVGAEEEVDAEAQRVMEFRSTAGGDDLLAVLAGDANDVLGSVE